MARKASPARLVIALSVAGVLAVFLLYTSIAGGGNPSLAPSELAGRTGEVQLAGLVVGPVRGDAHDGGLRFRLKDISGDSSTSVASPVHGIRAGPVQGRTSHRRGRRAREGHVRRAAGVDDHEVPVEVRAQERLRLTRAHA